MRGEVEDTGGGEARLGERGMRASDEVKVRGEGEFEGWGWGEG